MCGIVGYVGPKRAAPILLDGLRRLEYRGYDSAGLALQDRGKIEIVRAVGKLDNLTRAAEKANLEGTVQPTAPNLEDVFVAAAVERQEHAREYA